MYIFYVIFLGNFLVVDSGILITEYRGFKIVATCEAVMLNSWYTGSTDRVNSTDTCLKYRRCIEFTYIKKMVKKLASLCFCSYLGKQWTNSETEMWTISRNQTRVSRLVVRIEGSTALCTSSDKLKQTEGHRTDPDTKHLNWNS